MKSISFDTGINEYDLCGKVTVRFNPTDVGFLEKLSDSFAALDLIQEEVKLSQEEITDEKDVFNLAKNLDGKMRDILKEAEERYDLVLRRDAMDTPAVEAILEILRSAAFKKEIRHFTGNDYRDMGKIVAEV